MAAETFDIVIIGTGPAGIFAALELSRQVGLRIAMLDKGRRIERRRCPIQKSGGQCQHCHPCAILNGWGGAGAYPDGKLTLSPAIGGHLTDFLGDESVSRLIAEVNQTYVQFGATGPVYGRRNDEIEDLEKRAAMAQLRFVSVPMRHMGTEHAAKIMLRMHDTLMERGLVFRPRTPVKRILTADGRAVGVETQDGDQLRAAAVIVAPGVASRHTLLYGVEVKFYSNRLQLTPELETEVENLFACGDGAGVTRGLVQASASGLVAARAVAARLS